MYWNYHTEAWKGKKDDHKSPVRNTENSTIFNLNILQMYLLQSEIDFEDKTL